MFFLYGGLEPKFSLSNSSLIWSRYFCNASCCARCSSVSRWPRCSRCVFHELTTRPTRPTIPVINPPPSNATMMGPKSFMQCSLPLLYSQKYGILDGLQLEKPGCKNPHLYAAPQHLGFRLGYWTGAERHFWAHRTLVCKISDMDFREFHLGS